MMKERSSERIEMLSGGSEPLSLFDLSSGGACCFHTEKKRKGEDVIFTIKDFSVKGRVVYCQQRTDGYRLGLKFIDVSTDIQTQIDSLVENFSRGVPFACRVGDLNPDKKD